MFDDREDLYNWLVNSDLAMNKGEVESNDKKQSVILAPHEQIKSYTDLVNHFSCDAIQTLAWVTPSETEDEKPALNVIPIHIQSMQYSPD
jgi:hypothetical protein